MSKINVIILSLFISSISPAKDITENAKICAKVASAEFEYSYPPIIGDSENVKVEKVRLSALQTVELNSFREAHAKYIKADNDYGQCLGDKWYPHYQAVLKGWEKGLNEKKTDFSKNRTLKCFEEGTYFTDLVANTNCIYLSKKELELVEHYTNKCNINSKDFELGYSSYDNKLCKKEEQNLEEKLHVNFTYSAYLNDAFEKYISDDEEKFKKSICQKEKATLDASTKNYKKHKLAAITIMKTLGIKVDSNNEITGQEADVIKDLVSQKANLVKFSYENKTKNAKTYPTQTYIYTPNEEKGVDGDLVDRLDPNLAPHCTDVAGFLRNEKEWRNQLDESKGAN